MMNRNIDYKETIYSDGSSSFFSPGDAGIGDEVTVKFRAYKKNNIKEIYLCTIPDGERIYTRMNKTGTEVFFQYWKAKIKITTPFTNYKFFIVAKDSSFWYSQTGITSYIPQDLYDFKYIVGFKPVSWLEGRIFYQIFPDRFFDGNPPNNVKDNEYVYEGYPARAMKWGKTEDFYHGGTHLQFYGGDLTGIKKKTSYLKKLGINALYLTPIFLSPSNHKYDVQDYYKIDPHFGTNKELGELVDFLHKNNIRIILDGVFNHCGSANYWFNKQGFYKTGGSYKNQNSIHYDYFRFGSHPDGYACWLGVKTLPKLNYRSEKLKDEIYRGKNSIAKFWLLPPYNCDGWRLDVANMLARDGKFQGYKDVWMEFRKEVKKVKPESYIMGEHFFDAGELLKGDMLDGAMNYQGFYSPMVAWFCREIEFHLDHKISTVKLALPAEKFGECLSLYLAQLPWIIQQGMYNLLNSHDTPRFYSLLKKNKKLLRGALTILFTYPGVPGIFYGDEIGMEGLSSFRARSCMIWEKDKQDREIFEIYRQLIKLKKNHPALSGGGIKFLMAEGDVFSFVRFKGNRFVIVIVNRGGEKKVSLPLWKAGVMRNKFIDVFSKKFFKVKNGNLKIKLKAQGSLCLVTRGVF